MSTPVFLDGKELILDGTKLAWHTDRIAQWERGERFAPVTVGFREGVDTLLKAVKA